MDMTNLPLVSVKNNGWGGGGGWKGWRVSRFCYPNRHKFYAGHMGRSLFMIGLFGFCSPVIFRE